MMEIVSMEVSRNQRRCCLVIFFIKYHTQTWISLQCRRILGGRNLVRHHGDFGSKLRAQRKRLHCRLTWITSTFINFTATNLKSLHFYKRRACKTDLVAFKTEYISKLSNFNFSWTKTLYQKNLNNIAFLFFTFFKGARENKCQILQEI